MSIIYTNADGIINKRDEFLLLVKNRSPDLIAICETKLNDSIENEGLPTGYEILRKDRPGAGERGRGGGVCIMARDDLIICTNQELSCIDTRAMV